MRIGSQKGRARHRENTVPMINVVFLLLIFFLLAGTLQPQPPFELDPVATTLSPPAEVPANGLYVSSAGDLYFDGRRLGLAALPEVVRAAAQAKPDAFEVVVDRRLKGADLFPIMEALSKAGIQKIRLVTERSAG